MRILACLGLVIAGCGPSLTDARSAMAAPAVGQRAPAQPPQIDRVIIVTVDGVRAKDVLGDGARQRLPNLWRLIDRGVALGAPGYGAPMVASGPHFVSLPGYREILTGRRGNGCSDNECAQLAEPSLLDDARVALGLRADDVALVASWPVLQRAATSDPTAVTMSVGRHGGPTRARVAVDDAAKALLARGEATPSFPGDDDYRPDAITAPLALEYLRARKPHLFVVSLGDTDEWAHRGQVADYFAALAAVDDFLGALANEVAALDADGGRTLVVVTADHGRAANFRDHGRQPESQPVWLVAAGGPIGARGLVAAAGQRRLCDIAPTLRLWLGLDADASPRAGVPIPELTTRADIASLR
jgi:predicted AlkP superfamily pyrophosphatase or phosphodiesterase